MTNESGCKGCGGACGCEARPGGCRKMVPVSAETAVSRTIVQLIADLRDLRAHVPEGLWVAYSEEGKLRNGRVGCIHSVCIEGERHQCVTDAIGDDEEKASRIAHCIAEEHNAVPLLIDAIERCVKVLEKIARGQDGIQRVIDALDGKGKEGGS